jgi:nucleotide-binding universal stress UspA family protein
MSTAPVLLCYDGSADAIDAVDFTAQLLPGARALVVTVWKPVVEELLAGPAEAPPISDPVDANERQRRAARELAREGVRRAEAAGLRAEPLVVMASGAVWETIEELAGERDARLVVCGTSRTGIRSALPGSLAGMLVQHSSRAVLVVPSAKAARERRQEFEKEHRRKGVRDEAPPAPTAR